MSQFHKTHFAHKPWHQLSLSFPGLLKKVARPQNFLVKIALVLSPKTVKKSQLISEDSLRKFQPIMLNIIEWEYVDSVCIDWTHDSEMSE